MCSGSEAGSYSTFNPKPSAQNPRPETRGHYDYATIPQKPELRNTKHQIRKLHWFRGGLVFTAHRHLYHSTLGLSVRKKQAEDRVGCKGSLGSGPLIIGQLLRSNEKQSRGGLVFKARRLVPSLNSRPRVIKKKIKIFWGWATANRSGIL